MFILFPYYYIGAHSTLELLLRVELRTSSLPRMRSTTELKQHGPCGWSGKRDSNPRPPAWKASALSTELFPQKKMQMSAEYLSEGPHFHVGADGFEPPKSRDSRFTVCPIWPLWNTPFVILSLFQCTLSPSGTPEDFNPWGERCTIRSVF